MITTVKPDGEPAVVASERGLDACFGGCWWMQGGAVHCYRSYADFLSERAPTECGTKPEIQALMGFARTCAEDRIASTTQPCYVGFVPYEDTTLLTDGDHSDVDILTLSDIDALPVSKRHWYPMFFFDLALRSMPD